MSAMTDYAEKLALDWLFTNGAATRPTAWFVALHTAAPGETATGEISTGSAYARQTATFRAASSGAGTTDNNGAITFGPATTSNWGTVSGISVWDNGTIGSGNALIAGTLATARAINIGDSLQIADGALDLALA